MNADDLRSPALGAAARDGLMPPAPDPSGTRTILADRLTRLSHNMIYGCASALCVHNPKPLGSGACMCSMIGEELQHIGDAFDRIKARQTYTIVRKVERVHGRQTYTVEATSPEEAAKILYAKGGDFVDEELEIEQLSDICTVYLPSDSTGVTVNGRTGHRCSPT